MATETKSQQPTPLFPPRPIVAVVCAGALWTRQSEVRDCFGAAAGVAKKLEQSAELQAQTSIGGGAKLSTTALALAQRRQRLGRTHEFWRGRSELSSSTPTRQSPSSTNHPQQWPNRKPSHPVFPQCTANSSATALSPPTMTSPSPRRCSRSRSSRRRSPRAVLPT
jgi:hypothetical protein